MRYGKVESQRGHSLMVKFQPSKLAMRVRSPLPAGRSEGRILLTHIPCGYYKEGSLQESSMNKRRTKTKGREFSLSALKTPALLAVSLSLGAAFWMASLPIALAATVTPAEMIQVNLPHSTNLASAPKDEMLSAVCKAISKNQKEAPDIVRTAAGARKEFTADILKTAVHCLHDDKGDPDCELARSTLQGAIAVDAEQASSLTELFIGLTPTCIESPEEGPNAGGNNASNINGAPGSAGASGGGGNANTRAVCHNNHSIQVARSELAHYLQQHPGDTPGACEATPNANR